MHPKNKKLASPVQDSAADTEDGVEREDYAEHLAKVTPDADRNKAALQARYRALHQDPDNPDTE